MASRHEDVSLFERSYVKCFLKRVSWRALGSILEAPGLDFGAPELDCEESGAYFWFWEDVGSHI